MWRVVGLRCRRPAEASEVVSDDAVVLGARADLAVPHRVVGDAGVPKNNGRAAAPLFEVQFSVRDRDKATSYYWSRTV